MRSGLVPTWCSNPGSDNTLFFPSISKLEFTVKLVFAGKDLPGQLLSRSDSDLNETMNFGQLLADSKDEYAQLN